MGIFNFKGRQLHFNQLYIDGGIGVVNFYIQWSNNATLSLIQNRQLYQPNFRTTPIYNQKQRL